MLPRRRSGCAGFSFKIKRLWGVGAKFSGFGSATTTSEQFVRKPKEVSLTSCGKAVEKLKQ